MLLQDSSAKLADAIYNYHDRDEIRNKISPQLEVGVTEYPFLFTTRHNKNWLSVSGSQYRYNFDPLVIFFIVFINNFYGDFVS
jgi:hypothetical protein